MPGKRSFVVLVIALGTIVLGAPGAHAHDRPPPFCDSNLQPVETPAGRLCTHGGDEARALSGDSTTDPQLVVPPAPCEGDGVTGPRVHVLYGVPSDRTDRFAEQLSTVRDAVARADAYLDASTPSAAGQHVKWACSGGELSVTKLRLLPIGDDGAFTFDDAVTSLQNQVALGLGAADYVAQGAVYVVFVDHLADVYDWAGEASIRDDDSPELTNRNNLGGSYSMIAAFDGEVVLHEVLHNLGAVQLTAPHSSGGWHCHESQDVMCYQDGGAFFDAGGLMTADCADAPTWLVDCGADDYYSLTAAPGSYLATHWNVAASSFLTPAETLPASDPPPDGDAGSEPSLVEVDTEPTAEPTSPITSSAFACTIVGTSGHDVLRGTRGPDVICGRAGADEIYGLGGNDVVRAGPGRDLVYLGRGSDTAYGQRGPDRLHGGKGWDRLDGGRHADRCTSGVRRRCEA